MHSNMNINIHIQKDQKQTNNTQQKQKLKCYPAPEMLPKTEAAFPLWMATATRLSFEAPRRPAAKVHKANLKLSSAYLSVSPRTRGGATNDADVKIYLL